MKKLLLASCIASLSAATSANVFLPGIGVDGWASDSQFYRGAAFSQGYLTASGVENHVINPAFALDRMESAEARLTADGSFHGGAFSNLFGQNLGVYFGRPTMDALLYYYDSSGDESLDTASDNGVIDANLDGNYESISNIIDAYWATDLEFGRLGVRVNYRATSFSEENDLQDDNTNIETNGGFYEFNTTAGLIASDMPLETTLTFGLPLGGAENINENTGANTKNVQEIDIDKGLRWGATGKYTVLESNTDTTLVSGFIGGASANYRVTDETTSGSTTTTNADTTYLQERFTMGIIGSHARTINNQTQLVASAGLRRTSTTIGNENNNTDPNQPDYNEYTFWTLPVAIGVEFRKSEKTMLIGSVASNLFNSYNNSNLENDNGDAAEEDSLSSAWDMPNSNVQFGMAYQMTPRLATNFVINKALFVNGLDNGLTTTAEFTYDF